MFYEISDVIYFDEFIELNVFIYFYLFTGHLVQLFVSHFLTINVVTVYFIYTEAFCK